jgi:hypothetical protein
MIITCRSGRTVIIASVLVAMCGCARREPTTESTPHFSTPEQAVSALVDALEHSDIEAVERLFGPEMKGLLSSGDDVADRIARERFLSRYREKNQLVAGGPNDVVLQVGEDAWPLPIPMVRRDGYWSFDGGAGAEELVLRRIGRNELRAIQVMRGYVEAQQEYASTSRDGGPGGIYAQRVSSSPGKHDGLYWPTAIDEPPSPLGPLVAAATQEGYSTAEPSGRPYHGYRYRMLFAQGSAAPGGARDYIVDGKLEEGFALLAYPEKYGASGIMTFMVNQDGIVWQRDLGVETSKLAPSMRVFSPDRGWIPIPQES